MESSPQNIYDPIFVADLFSKMSGSYDRMNTITSFEKQGFEVEYLSFFGGCASGLQGRKPI